jgi:hypothetical protein
MSHAPHSHTHTLQLRGPVSRVLVAALCVLALYLLLAEILLRVLPVHRVLGAPMLGSAHRQFEQQWFRLQSYVAEHGPVDCIMIGDSTVMSDFAPEVFNAAYRQQTGEGITCYNFGVGALSVEGLAMVAEILIGEYAPRHLLVGVEPLDFTVPHDNQGEADLGSVPWARYQLGQFSPAGWLYSNSSLYRYMGVIGKLLTFRLDYRELLQRTAEERSVGADGYSALEGTGPFDVTQPPDRSIDHPYIEHYFAAMSPFRMLPENLSALEHILAMNGATTEVVVVEMPITDTFYTFLGNGEEDYRLFVYTIGDRAATQGVAFLRMEDLRSLPAPVWFNYNHLNSMGAPIFSRWLGSSLHQENAH